MRVNGRVIKDKSAGGKYQWDFDISPLDGVAFINNNNYRRGSLNVKIKNDHEHNCQNFVGLPVMPDKVVASRASELKTLSPECP